MILARLVTVLAVVWGSFLAVQGSGPAKYDEDITDAGTRVQGHLKQE